MNTNLLASKFYYPPHRLELVPRPELLENLDAGLNGKLTVVSAPAGFGKTTVVSEWIRHCGHPTAWLSVDKNDNDVSRFLIYLIAALQHIDAEIGVDIQAALEETTSPHYEILLARLISEIERFPNKSIIVLDDYHVIYSKQVHEAINFLIEYLPPTIHLVISGRTDPPLPISRLRVQGEVNEIRTPKLRFTIDEVDAYLNDLLGFNLPSDGIAAMEARTEGWIASLKLAALSMQGRDDWSEFIAKFSGSNRYIIDYLIDEVMARQPEGVQEFLRRTSILERFCPPLCEYVVGDGNNDLDVIDYLDRSNLFLIPLDDRKEWFRYHHLFADFLGQRLRDTEPDIIPELHRRASQWYKNQGFMDDSIQHSLDAGDFESAAGLIDEIAIDLVIRREPNELLKLVAQLPHDLYKDYPMLCIFHAFALVFMGELEMVESALSLAEVNKHKPTPFPNPGYINTVRAYLASNEGDLHKSIKLSEQALEEMSQLTPDRVTLIFRGSAIIWLGVNHRLLGHLDRAKELFLEAAELNQTAGNFYAALASFEQLAQLAVIRGQLYQAVDLFEDGLNLAKKWTEVEGKLHGSLIASAGPQLGLGTALYQLNELEDAAAHIQRSADLLELGELWKRIDAYVMLAYVKQAEGDFKAAIELANKAGSIEDDIPGQQSETTDSPSLARLRILLSRSKPELAYLLSEASHRIDRLGIDARDDIDFTSDTGYPREYMYSDLARLLIAQDQPAEALPLLMLLLEAAIKMERHGDEINYLVVLALAYHALENEQAALDSLQYALNLAVPKGYVRLFVDEGQPMQELLQYAISQNVMPDYASRLLASFPNRTVGAAQSDEVLIGINPCSIDSLSEREIEVLRLMAEGYKYKEIADRLVVSINTVRHHIRNVYSKFYVNNRTQAIGKAKELNLL